MASRKDFVAVAHIIKSERDAIRHRTDLPQKQALVAAAGVTNVARRLADRFAEDNPRFDRSRFLEACGVKT